MKKSQNKFSAMFIVVSVLLLLLIAFVVSECKKPKDVSHISNTSDESYELPCAGQPNQAYVQSVPIVYVPIEPKQKKDSWVPPVELIPSLVKSKVQPPWRKLCLNC